MPVGHNHSNRLFASSAVKNTRTVSQNSITHFTHSNIYGCSRSTETAAIVLRADIQWTLIPARLTKHAATPVVETAKTQVCKYLTIVAEVRNVSLYEGRDESVVFWPSYVTQYIPRSTPGTGNTHDSHRITLLPYCTLWVQRGLVPYGPVPSSKPYCARMIAHSNVTGGVSGSRPHIPSAVAVPWLIKFFS